MKTSFLLMLVAVTAIVVLNAAYMIDKNIWVWDKFNMSVWALNALMWCRYATKNQKS
jgi:hypothetical protein